MYEPPPADRFGYLAAVRKRLGIPRYASEIVLHRGKCLARTTRSRCRSRYGITRLSIDYTSAERQELVATRECAICGHTWYRVAVPALGEYQSVALTLILPSEQRRWYARGKWHVTGQDAIEIRNASWADLMSAADEWRERNGNLMAAKARARAKAEAASAARHAEAQAWLAHLAERDAQRAAEEAAAAAREAAS